MLSGKVVSKDEVIIREREIEQEMRRPDDFEPDYSSEWWLATREQEGFEEYTERESYSLSEDEVSQGVEPLL